MNITRSYYNATDIIRVDEIYMSYNPVSEEVKYKFNQNGPLVSPKRSVVTKAMHATGVAARTVTSIEVYGDFDFIETVSGDYEYATKTLGSGQVVTVDMTDLPKIGDTV